MTKQLRPNNEDWSEDLEAAAVVFHTPIRLQIMKFLRINGLSMRHQIEDATGLTRGVLAQNIKILEEAGVIETTRGEEKSTRPLMYRLAHGRADYLWDLYGSWWRS
jgi:DNA-binding MarR family transcriptional regulator